AVKQECSRQRQGNSCSDKEVASRYPLYPRNVGQNPRPVSRIGRINGSGSGHGRARAREVFVHLRRSLELPYLNVHAASISLAGTALQPRSLCTVVPPKIRF